MISLSLVENAELLEVVSEKSDRPIQPELFSLYRRAIAVYKH
jgi:hypothetical protein